MQTGVVATITLREAMPAGSYEHCTTPTEPSLEGTLAFIPARPMVAQFPPASCLGLGHSFTQSLAFSAVANWERS